MRHRRLKDQVIMYSLTHWPPAIHPDPRPHLLPSVVIKDQSAIYYLLPFTVHVFTENYSPVHCLKCTPYTTNMYLNIWFWDGSFIFLETYAWSWTIDNISYYLWGYGNVSPFYKTTKQSVEIRDSFDFHAWKLLRENRVQLAVCL